MKKPRVKTFQREDSKYDWHLIGANNRVMCGSTQGYESRSKARAAGRLSSEYLAAFFASLRGKADTW